jgi:predicted secreted protein
VCQAVQTPRATNPANTRLAATSERISFIVVTSFLHEALRFGYVCAEVGEEWEKSLRKLQESDSHSR